MTDLPLPHKTINANNSRLARVMSEFRDKYMQPFDDIVSGKRPEFTFNQLAATQFVKAFEDVDIECLAQNIQMAAYVMSLKSCAELIQEYGLNEIQDAVFPEQVQAFRQILKYIEILNNYKPKTEDS